MWDFETEPEFAASLDWAREFVRTEVVPLDVDQGTLDLITAPLKEQVKEQGMWAAHLRRERFAEYLDVAAVST